MDIPMDIPVDIPFIMFCSWDSMDMLMGYKGSRESQHWDFSKKNVATTSIFVCYLAIRNRKTPINLDEGGGGLFFQHLIHHFRKLFVICVSFKSKLSGPIGYL